MPSLRHQAAVDLFRSKPGVLVALVRNRLGLKRSERIRLRDASSDLTLQVPAELRADLVMVAGGRHPRLAMVVEVQLRVDHRKEWVWPLYAAAARARLKCPAVVVVVSFNRAVARWASRAIAVGGRNAFRVVVLESSQIPLITDEARAARNPEAMLLSVLAHGKKPGAERMIPAAERAARRLDEQNGSAYLVMVGEALAPEARAVWEAKMLEHVKIPKKDRFKAPPLRMAYEYGVECGQAKGKVEGEAKGEAKGEARGRAQGKAEALLAVLEIRRIKVPASVRARLQVCRNNRQLDTWLRRAVVAESIAEVLGNKR